MNFKLQLIVPLFASVFATISATASEIYPRSTVSEINPENLTISEYQPSPFIEPTAKKEETEIRVLNEESTQESMNELPGYFGAVSGGIISFSFVIGVQSEFIRYYDLGSLIILIGVIVGLFWSYSTHVRNKTINEHIKSVLATSGAVPFHSED